MNHAIKTPKTITIITLRPHTQSKKQYYNNNDRVKGKMQTDVVVVRTASERRRKSNRTDPRAQTNS
jgi:hypothetical protein